MRSIKLAIGAALALPTQAICNPVPGDPVENEGATGIDLERFVAARPVDPEAFARITGAGGLGVANEQSLIDVNGGIDGDMPREVAFLADGSAAAIVNRDSNNVTFLDVASREIVRTVAVGEFPVHIAATPDGRFVITANVLSDSLSVIDLSDFSVTEVAVTGSQPYRVETTADGAFAVVGVINNANDATFSVIDLDTLSEVRSFPGGSQGVVGGFFNSTFPIFGNLFTSFAIAPDNRTIVLPESANPNSTIRLFDLTTGAEVAALGGLPTGARGVDISDDGTLAAVTHIGNGDQITIVDLTTRTVAGTIAADVDEFIRIYPDNSHVITHKLNDTLIFELATGAETFRQQSGGVGDIELSFDGAIAFIANFNSRLLDLASQAFVRTISFAPTADSATSPVDHHAVGLNNRFGENAHLYDIDGANGSLLAGLPSGPPPEGDAPFDVDVSADGAVAMVGMTLSGNVAIIEVAPQRLRGLVETGRRVMDVEITPDGLWGVSCDGDSDQVSIIDLANVEVVAQLPINTRPGRVLISPDSSMAYVLNVAGSDRIWFIELDGADSRVVGNISAGQTGSSFGAQYSETSGLALSDDGAILAVCDSFNDNLKLIDTADQSLIADVPVGDFPIRAAFNRSGSRCYVTNINGDTVSVVDVPGQTAIATIDIAAMGGDRPLTVVTDFLDAFAYVGDYNPNGGSGLYVIDQATNGVVAQVPADGGLIRDLQFRDNSNRFFALVNANGQTQPTLLEYSAAGAGTSVQSRWPTSGNALDFDLSDFWNTAIVSQPFLDGVDAIRPTIFCSADVGHDGDVDADDFFAFLDFFVARDPRADINGDRVWDSEDFFRYLDLFVRCDL